VELHRRHAEVEQHAVGGVEAARARHRGHVSEVGVYELDTPAERGEPFAGEGERTRVGVEAEQAAVWPARLEDRARVPARANGAVDVTPARAGRQELDGLVQKHGCVWVRAGLHRTILGRGRLPSRWSAVRRVHQASVLPGRLYNLRWT